MMTVGDNESLNIYALEMLRRMEHEAREKWHGWAVSLVKRWPPLSSITETYIIGSMVMTSMSAKHRYMMEKSAIEFADTYVSPSDLARLYLNIKFKGVKRRITTAQWKAFYETKRSTPLYVSPCQLDNAVYIDIRSAYWSILRAVGWDVDYMPEKWLRVVNPLTVNDFPFASQKMARNCLVSLAADGTRVMQIWDGAGVRYQKGGNPLVNKMLWAFVCDTLNTIAYEVVQAGAVYAFTDGFIIHSDHADHAAEIIASWGLTSSIKHSGPCYVSGAGAYSFPDYTTTKFRRQAMRPVSKIAPVSVDWLKSRFKHFSDKHDATSEFDVLKYQERLSRKMGRDRRLD
jgi:hypothetical protein